MLSFGETVGAFSGGGFYVEFGVLVHVGRQWAWQNPEVKVTEFIV